MNLTLKDSIKQVKLLLGTTAGIRVVSPTSSGSSSGGGLGQTIQSCQSWLALLPSSKQTAKLPDGGTLSSMIGSPSVEVGTPQTETNNCNGVQ